MQGPHYSSSLVPRPRPAFHHWEQGYYSSWEVSPSLLCLYNIYVAVPGRNRTLFWCVLTLILTLTLNPNTKTFSQQATTDDQHTVWSNVSRARQITLLWMFNRWRNRHMNHCGTITCEYSTHMNSCETNYLWISNRRRNDDVMQHEPLWKKRAVLPQSSPGLKQFPVTSL